MMKNLIRKLALFLLLAPVVILAGCYTQLGGTKDEATPDEQSYYNDEYMDSTGAGQYAYNDAYPRYYDDYSAYALGLSYYYPPFGNPWFYGNYPGYGPGYGYGYGYGYYSIGGPYGPYGSYYGYPYGYPYEYYGWAYGGGPITHYDTKVNSGTRRTIGNIRATGATRGMESGYMPSSRTGGSSIGLPAGAARRSPTPAATTRTSGSRSGSSSVSGVDRAGYGRTGSSSTGSGSRSSTPQSRPSGSSRGSSSRGSSSGGSSYTPPPPPPPPPSNSGSSSGSGSDRGSSSSGSSSSGSSSSGSSRGGGSRR